MPELSHYEVVRELAAGGMGKVYVARHTQLGREVALKVMHAWRADGETLERFVLEGQATARLKHPGVVAVHEVGSFQGQPCIVMDLIAGESLQDRLERDGPLASTDAARIAGDVAAALAHAHEVGILHRDLKPANVLVSTEGRTLLTDFGIAKILSDTRDTLTRSGQMLGTPAYMPPEQADGNLEAMGPPVDVYGLGATLYALLTGQPPFKGSSAINILAQVFAKDPRPPRALNPEVSPDLESVCLKCLAKDPAERYGSASELAEDLARFLAGEPVLGRPPRRKRKLWPVMIPLALTVLTGGGIALTHIPDPPPASERRAPPTSSGPKAPTPAELEASAALRSIKSLAKPRERVAALDRWIAENPEHPKRKEARALWDATRQGFVFATTTSKSFLHHGVLGGQAKGPLDPTGLWAIVGGDHNVKLHDVVTGKIKRVWLKRSRVTGLAALPDGALATVGTKLYRVRITAKKPERIEGLRLRPLGKRRPVAVTPSAALLAVADLGSVVVAPLAGDAPPRRLASGEPGYYAHLAFLGETHLVGVVRVPGRPARMRLETWDVEAGRRMHDVGLAGGPRGLAAAPDGARFAVSYHASRGKAAVYDRALRHVTPLGEVVGAGEGPSVGSESVAALAFSPNGKRVHVMAKDKGPTPLVVRATWGLEPLRRIGKRRVVRRIEKQTNVPAQGSLAVSPDGRWALHVYQYRCHLWGLPD